MNIREVEELTGLKKANIRYYEQEGLLKPERNAINNYREYTQEDVICLKRIKVLRALDIPVLDIRRLQMGEKTVSELAEERERAIEKEMTRMEELKEMCRSIKSGGMKFEDLDVSVLDRNVSYINIEAEAIRRQDRIYQLEKYAEILKKGTVLFLLIYWALRMAGSIAGIPLTDCFTIAFLIVDLGTLMMWMGVRMKIHRIRIHS